MRSAIVVRGHGHAGVHRRHVPDLRHAQVALVAAIDGVDDLEDGDVDDGHRPARPAGPELVAERVRRADTGRRVIEARRIDRHMVPVVQPFEGGRRYGRHRGRRGPRAEGQARRSR